MKTAKAMPSDISSSRRAQPVRHTRTNPPRSSGSLLRSFDSRGVSGGGLGNGQNLEQRTEIYPAITHFADAITALPKELVRHFTLLKEVDAKIFAPEERLEKLIDAALNCPLPENRPQPDALQIAETASAPTSAPESVNGSSSRALLDTTSSNPEATEPYDAATAAWGQENVPRRKLFRECTLTMQEMLVSLDEKNHVLSTATEALNKQLWRLDDVLPYIEREVSDEARFGSETHWAYTENRINKPVERQRRDIGTGHHGSNSHHLSVDEAAARSESRKQALLAKKGRTHHADSDFDDHHDHRHKGESSKRAHGNSKKGRPAETNVGLGISNGPSVNGNPPSKRRKVEKGPGGGAVMERSLSSVFGSNGAASKAKGNSPRETPVPEGSKKKSKAATTTNGHARKRTVASNAMSPSIASSPIHSTFADSKAARASPPLTNNARPSTARARQNSTQSLVESARQRPSSSASNKQNGNNNAAVDLSSVVTPASRTASEVKSVMKESASNSKSEIANEDTNKDDAEKRAGPVLGSRRDSLLKREESDINGDSTPPMQTINTTITTTKSGRASKPSTPAIPSFPEPVRSRSARNVLEQTATNKRSHKKGAGQAAQLIAARTADDDAASSLQDDDDMDPDADEPTYCYCNGVSYGEMVACDADGCAKEWFHLECVGLKVAPRGNAKWYCDDCKENMKNSKRFNGR